MQYIVSNKSMLAYIQKKEMEIYHDIIKRHRKDELSQIKEKFQGYEGLKQKIIEIEIGMPTNHKGIKCE